MFAADKKVKEEAEAEKLLQRRNVRTDLRKSILRVLVENNIFRQRATTTSFLRNCTIIILEVVGNDVVFRSVLPEYSVSNIGKFKEFQTSQPVNNANVVTVVCPIFSKKISVLSKASVRSDRGFEMEVKGR